MCAVGLALVIGRSSLSSLWRAQDDLVNFGAKHGVDFVAASFVQRGSNIDEIREVRRPLPF